MNNGLKDSELLAKSFMHPHVSTGGNVVCTNPKCKERIAKSNATISMEDRMEKGLLFTNSTKVFIMNDGVVAECVCGSKYNVSEVFAKGIFFKKNR